MRFKVWLENLAIKGNYKQSVFQQLVAARYMLAPTVEPNAVAAFRDLEAKVVRQNEMLKSRFNMRPTTDDPYKSMKDMTRQINAQKASGVRRPEVRVFSGGTKHPVFADETNVMFRGVHDTIAHFAGQHPFNARGEYAAYSRHLKTLCNVDQMKSGGCPAAGALFTEIVGQTSCYYIYGDYPPQKAALLVDFDWYRVGALNPRSGLNNFFELRNKDLLPRVDFDPRRFAQAYPQLVAEMQKQPSSFLKASQSNSASHDGGGSPQIPY